MLQGRLAAEVVERDGRNRRGGADPSPGRGEERVQRNGMDVEPDILDQQLPEALEQGSGQSVVASRKQSGKHGGAGDQTDGSAGVPPQVFDDRMKRLLVGQDDRSPCGELPDAFGGRPWPGRGELFKPDIKEQHRFVVRTELPLKLGERRGNQRLGVGGLRGDGPALHYEAAFAEQCRGLLRTACFVEEQRAGQPLPQRLEAPDPGILTGKCWPAELDDVDL